MSGKNLEKCVDFHGFLKCFLKRCLGRIEASLSVDRLGVFYGDVEQSTRRMEASCHRPYSPLRQTSHNRSVCILAPSPALTPSLPYSPTWWSPQESSRRVSLVAPQCIVGHRHKGVPWSMTAEPRHTAVGHQPAPRYLAPPFGGVAPHCTPPYTHLYTPRP